MFIRYFLVFLFILASPYAGGAAETYKAYPGVIHIHSQFSSGDHSISELVQLAGGRGLKYIVITDHDLVTMEYGLFPLRNLVKRKIERPSIIQEGPQRYLGAIADATRAQKGMVVIPGAQSSPYYYWTGNPLKGNLTAHDYRKEILILGVYDPDIFLSLPLLHHGPSTRFLLKLLPGVLFPMAAAILSGLLIKRNRLVGTIALICSLLILANARPLRTSRFTPYDGNQGIAPYQDFLNYAKEKGVLTFWTHPESNFSTQGKKLGPATFKTEKYPGDLLLAQGYTGFSAIYGDTSTIEKPGRQWDQLLQQYCNGFRDEPVWAIGDADFHGIESSEPLDTYVTVIWADNFDSDSLLNGLREGRCYAVHQKEGRGLRLDRFQLQNSGGKKAWSGETLFATGIPILTVRLSASDQSSLPLKVKLIKNGAVWHEIKGHTPLSITKRDNTLHRGKSYYRIEAFSKSSQRLISNPIFVEKR